MHFQSLPPLPKRKARVRALKPKVKTGCITCRSRRVKCDEERPSCSRCMKSNRTCEGYGVTKSRGALRETQTRRPLLPSSGSRLKTMTIPSEISKRYFGDDTDSYLFRYYYHETADELSGTLETSIWNRLLLQASEDHPFLRRGLIVIGALNWGMKKGVPRIRSVRDDPIQSYDSIQWTHEKWLLSCFGKFLGDSRHAMSQPTCNKRLALMVCLVVVCIERLQWRLSSSVNHIRSGMKLLSTTDLAKEFIEDDLVQQFQSLDLEAAIFRGFNLKSHDGPQSGEEPERKLMPDVFTTISEARLDLQRIIQQIRRYILESRSDGRVSSSLSYGLETTPNCHPEISSSSPVPRSEDSNTFTGVVYHYPARTLPLLSPEPASHESEIQQWSLAFAPLQSSIPKTSDDYLTVCVLVAQSLVVKINLAGCLCPTELIYDSYLEDFQAILRVTQSFLAHPRSSRLLKEGSFSLTSRIIYPLQLVADKCRDRSLRREAIGLLKSKPWREGAWSSLAAATIATWFMETEEDAVETDFIPEKARLRLVESYFTEGHVPRQFRRGTVKCLRGIGPQAELKVAAWDWVFDPEEAFGSSSGQFVKT